jgi:hypothetical protein
MLMAMATMNPIRKSICLSYTLINYSSARAGLMSMDIHLIEKALALLMMSCRKTTGRC